MGVWGLRPQRVEGRALAFRPLALTYPHPLASKPTLSGSVHVEGSDEW